MITLTAPCSPVNVGPPAFTEVLPATRSCPHAAIRWTPADPSDLPAPGGLPPAGTLVIDQRRATVAYAVSEFSTPWEGRAFRLDKLDPGTDPTAEAYDVFVGRNRQDRRCCCKGFQRWGECKHTLACLALVENGWL